MKMMKNFEKCKNHETHKTLEEDMLSIVARQTWDGIGNVSTPLVALNMMFENVVEEDGRSLISNQIDQSCSTICWLQHVW